MQTGTIPMRKAAAIFLTGLVISAGSIDAAPLDPNACANLKAEKSKMATEALKADMAQGADWAKTNLPAERLSAIRAFIELEEQIAFRCPNPKPPAQPKAAAASPGEPAGAGSGGPLGTNAAEPGAASAAPKVRKQPAKTTDAGPAGAGPVGDAGDAKPQRKSPPGNLKPVDPALGPSAQPPRKSQGLSP